MSKCKDKCECTEENVCSCGEHCECDNECNCEDDCQCDKECMCEHECSCDDDCGCDECSCENDCKYESNKELDEALKKISELQEALLREKADVQNYKRRHDEELARMLKYSEENIVREFLPIIDNFERAIKMDDNDLSDDVSKFLSGFKIIYTSTLNLLNKFDVKEIEAAGVEFDPTYHHAVLTEHDDSKPEGVVLEVLQKGYMYKDRVIRPCMVKVNE